MAQADLARAHAYAVKREADASYEKAVADGVHIVTQSIAIKSHLLKYLYIYI